MKKYITLIILILLTLSGCSKESISNTDTSYLVMDSNAHLNTLTIKVWMNSDFTKQNLDLIGKELTNKNKSNYGAIKIDFYKVKEEIGYPTTKPDAYAIWGDRGKFLISENKDNNLFVIEIPKQKKFTPEEFEIYNSYLKTSKEKGDLEALAEAYDMTMNEITILAHNMSSRFIDN